MTAAGGRHVPPAPSRLRLGPALVLASLLLARAGRAEEFPPFLPPPGEFPSEIRAGIVSVWTAYTLTRSVEGRPARAPLDVYRLLVDHPEVTAAAARHLGLAQYRVRPLGDGRYAAEDGEGAEGTYRVLVRDEQRRIMFTEGSHDGRILGRISGASLTILAFEPGMSEDGVPAVVQRIETFVRIDNRLAAFFARLLLPLFSGYADRKIAETFNVTSEVAEWAAREPAYFCAWLATPAGAAGHVALFAEILPPCR